MTIKVISYGKKKGIITAQIVLQFEGSSRTTHVWQRSGTTFGDMWGVNYTLPYKAK